jgi:K+-transporting ATPase ATPase A chain
MQSSFTPLASLISLANIQLGNLLFGGVGIGLCNIALFSILLCFLIRLFSGRKPLYLGKCIGIFEVGMAILSLGLFFLAIALFSSAALGMSREGITISEVVYAYSSTSANNGSAFASLHADTPWYNYTLACAMLIGRFGTMIPVLALAGAFAKKNRSSDERAWFPVKGLSLGVLLFAGAVVIGLIFFLPSWIFGPILQEMHRMRETL